MEIGYKVGHKKKGECPLCMELEGEKHRLLTLRRRIKSHLLFAGIIRSSPFSPR